jgi:hypothetical protein
VGYCLYEVLKEKLQDFEKNQKNPENESVIRKPVPVFGALGVPHLLEQDFLEALASLSFRTTRAVAASSSTRPRETRIGFFITSFCERRTKLQVQLLQKLSFFCRGKPAQDC